MSAPAGPTLDVTIRRLDCGCVVDDAGGIWAPCPEIASMHAEAIAAVRAGVTAWTMDRGGRRWRGAAPVTLGERLDDMAAHVRRGRTAEPRTAWVYEPRPYEQDEP